MKPQQQLRDDVAHERAGHAAYLEARRAEQGRAPGRCFFVDESGIAPGLRANSGWARRGQRCVDYAPYRAPGRRSLVGWTTSTGSGHVLVVEGSVKRATFAYLMRRFLLPRLRVGDTVVWDNHTIHDDKALRAEIEAKGAHLRPLPRYSPDLNPAEMLWSTLKRRLRRALADTAEQVEAALGEAVSQIAAAEVVAWARHCGFTAQPQPV